MKLGEMIQENAPSDIRVKISGLNQTDDFGNRVWTGNLTDAQKLAYWDRDVLKHILVAEEKTLYCILVED